MRKPCQILRNDSSRYSDSLHAAAKGLGNAQDKSDVFYNMLSLPNLMNVVAYDGGDSQFSILVFPPPIFLMGVPSGCLVMRRAEIGRDLLSPTPRDAQFSCEYRFRSDSEARVEIAQAGNIKRGVLHVRPCWRNGGGGESGFDVTGSSIMALGAAGDSSGRTDSPLL